MAGDIGLIAGAAVEARSSPIAASTNRSAKQHSENQEAPSLDSQRKRASPEDGNPEARALLTSMLERAQNVTLSNNTMLSFERDQDDGQMYLHVKDKRTGEELYRIPKKCLADIDPHLWQHQQVDVRI